MSKPKLATKIVGSKLSWMISAGIAESDRAAADILVQRESGWHPTSVNKSSGACGLAQALPCSKILGNWKNPITSLKWMNSYVKARYGGWQQALNFHYANKWY